MKKTHPRKIGKLIMSSLNDNFLHTRYTSPNPSVWSGRCDGGNNDYFHQIVRPIDVRHINLQLPSVVLQENGFGIIGFCSDEGIRRNQGRTGAAAGPRSLRECLGKLPIPPAPFGLYDFGDVHCSDRDLESSQKALAQVVAHLFHQKVHPVLFGGGHEITWGSFQGIASAFPNASIGIINFDAHYDLRPLLEGGKGSSGTSFYQIAKERADKNLAFNYLCVGVQQYGNSQQLFDRARGLNVKTIHAEELFDGDLSVHRKAIRSFAAKCDYIHLTVCLDVFQASICPGVSAPQALGIFPWQVIPLMREAIDSLKTISLEIAELSPPHDIDMRSAKLGALLACDYMHYLKKAFRK